MGHDVFFQEADYGASCYFVEEPPGKWMGWVLFTKVVDVPLPEGPGYRRIVPGGPFGTRDALLHATHQFVIDAVKDGRTGL